MCFCWSPFLFSISLFCHLIFQICFVPSVILHTSSSIKAPLINRNPPPQFSLWALTLFFPWTPSILSALFSPFCRKLKGKNLKIWVLVLIYYPLNPSAWLWADGSTDWLAICSKQGCKGPHGNPIEHHQDAIHSPVSCRPVCRTRRAKASRLAA